MACCRVNPARSAFAICCSASASCPLKRPTLRRRRKRTSAAGAKNPAAAATAAQRTPPSQYPPAASASSAQRLSRTTWRGSMKRNMALKSRTERARYLRWYCPNARWSTSKARKEEKNAEPPASSKTTPAAISGPPRRGGALVPVAADDLDRPVPLLLQLAGTVAREERPLVDDAALLLRIQVVGIAQQQGERAQVLRQREHLGFLGQGEQRHRRESTLLLRHGRGARGDPAGGEHHDVLQQRHRAQLLRLWVAEAADHIDVVVGPHPEADGVPLLHVDGDGPALGVDESGQLDLARGLEMADQDGIARLERRQHALADRALDLGRPLLVRLDERVGDESRGHLPDRDHLRGELGSLLDVDLRAKDVDGPPPLPGGALAGAQ